MSRATGVDMILLQLCAKAGRRECVPAGLIQGVASATLRLHRAGWVTITGNRWGVTGVTITIEGERIARIVAPVVERSDDQGRRAMTVFRDEMDAALAKGEPG